MRRSLARPFLLLTVCFSLAHGAQAPRDPNALQLGASIGRTIAWRQSHRFSIVLEKDQCAQVVVDQRGIDLVVRVQAPDRRNVAEFDSPNGANGADDSPTGRERHVGSSLMPSTPSSLKKSRWALSSSMF